MHFFGRRIPIELRRSVLCLVGVPIDGVTSRLTRLLLFAKLSSALAGIFTQIVQNVVILAQHWCSLHFILCTFGADYTVPVRFRRPIGLDCIFEFQ